jgi:hypothetical protein
LEHNFSNFWNVKNNLLHSFGNFTAFTSAIISFDETFSKINASGSIEEFWCSSGEKMIVPSTVTVNNGYQLECGPTGFYIDYTIPYIYPVKAASGAIDYYANTTSIKFICDVWHALKIFISDSVFKDWSPIGVS